MDVATMTSSVFGIPHVETSVLAFFFVGLALEVVVLSKPTHALVSYFALLVGFLVAPNISISEHCVLKFYYFCVLIKDSFNFPNYFRRTSAVNSFSGSRNCSLIVVFPILVAGLTSHLPRLPLTRRATHRPCVTVARLLVRVTLCLISVTFWDLSYCCSGLFIDTCFVEQFYMMYSSTDNCINQLQDCVCVLWFDIEHV